MPFEGSLRETPLNLVLDAIGSERQTGILTVQDAQEIVAVTFLRGEIVGADSLSGGDEILGQALAEAHVVRPDEFAAMVALHRTGGGRVSDLLLQRGLLDRPTLLRGLRTQSLILLRTVMQWSDGTYKFYAGEDLSFEEGFEPIDVDEVLGHGGSFGASARSPQQNRGTGAHELFGVPESAASAAEAAAAPAAAPAPPAPPAPMAAPSPAARAEGPDLGKAGGATPLADILASVAAGAPAGRAGPSPAPAASRPPTSAFGRSQEGQYDPGQPLPVGPDAKWDPAKAVHSRDASEAMGWRSAAWLAACLILPLLAASRFPSQTLAPLPWSVAVYGELEENSRRAVFRRIDAAARTYCLVEGQYPPSLEALAAQGILARGDLRTAAGESVVYSGAGDSYALRTLQGGQVSGEAAVESTAGNIFLDAAFSENAGTEGKPLVLLD